MPVISNNNIKVNYEITGLDTLSKAADGFDKISKEERDALQQLIKLNEKLKQTGKEGKEATDKVKDGFDGMGSSLKGFGALLATTFTIGAITAFTKQVIETTARFEALRKSINFTAGDAEKGSDNFAYLTKIANELGISLVAVAGSFKGFSTSAKQAGLSSLQSEKIFTAVSKAVAVMGLNSEQAERTLKALEQMLSKGSVSSEELRQQLGDALPGAFGLFAAAIGVSTKELQKMLQNGEVLAATTLPKFAKELEKVYGAEVAKGIHTINAEQGRLSTQWDLFIESLGTKLGPAYQKGLQATVEFLKDLRRAINDEEKNIAEDSANTKREYYDEIVKQSEKLSDAQLEIAYSNSVKSIAIEKKKLGEVQYILATEISKRERLNQLQTQAGREESGPNNAEKNAKAALLAQIKLVASIEGELQALRDVRQERDVNHKKTTQDTEIDLKALKSLYEARVKLLEVEKRAAELRIQLNTEAGFEREIALTRNAEKFGELRLAIDREFAAKGLQEAKDNAAIQGLINRTLVDDSINLIKKEAEEGHKKTQGILDDIKKMQEANNDFETKRGQAQQDRLNKERELNNEIIKLEKDKAEKILEIDKKSKDEQKQLERDLIEIQIQEVQGYAEVFSAVLDGISNQIRQNSNNELTILDRRYNEEIRLAGENQQKITELNEKRRAEEKAIRTKEFEAQRAAAIAQVIFKTAPIIAEYLATGVLAPLAVAALATSAAQIAFIAAQPIPEYAESTKGIPHKGGLALVGDGGQSELVITPSGKVFWTPATDTLMNLPKGSEVFTPQQVEERFLASQMSTSKRKSGPDPIIMKLDAIDNTLKGLPIHQLAFDERGFTKTITRANSRETSRNNKFPSRK